MQNTDAKYNLFDLLVAIALLLSMSITFEIPGLLIGGALASVYVNARTINATSETYHGAALAIALARSMLDEACPARILRDFALAFFQMEIGLAYLLGCGIPIPAAYFVFIPVSIGILRILTIEGTRSLDLVAYPSESILYPHPDDLEWKNSVCPQISPNAQQAMPFPEDRMQFTVSNLLYRISACAGFAMLMSFLPPGIAPQAWWPLGALMAAWGIGFLVEVVFTPTILAVEGTTVEFDYLFSTRQYEAKALTRITRAFAGMPERSAYFRWGIRPQIEMQFGTELIRIRGEVQGLDQFVTRISSIIESQTLLAESHEEIPVTSDLP